MKGSTHVLLGKGSGKNLDISYWEKGNFIMINGFKYGQTWKICPSPLSLSFYSTFNVISYKFCQSNHISKNYLSKKEMLTVYPYIVWGTCVKFFKEKSTSKNKVVNMK